MVFLDIGSDPFNDPSAHTDAFLGFIHISYDPWKPQKGPNAIIAERAKAQMMAPPPTPFIKTKMEEAIEAKKAAVMRKVPEEKKAEFKKLIEEEGGVVLKPIEPIPIVKAPEKPATAAARIAPWLIIPFLL